LRYHLLSIPFLHRLTAMTVE